MKEIVVSGIQTSGSIHLGNYLGAIKNWVALQSNYETFFFLADLHAITTNNVSQEELSLYTLQSLAIYIASGISPSKSIIFSQSSIQLHAELAWIISCLTPIGWLKRMVQFKDKVVKQQEEKVSSGLFFYPILMASDILLYNADIVPVGEDQKQHLELTKNIAKMFNKKLCQNIFKIPKPLVIEHSKKIMDLQDGTKKMSKSSSYDLSRVNITDSNDQIQEKIKKAKTDSIKEISYDVKTRPEVSNLLNIFSSLSDRSIDELITDYSMTGFNRFKKDLTELLVFKLSDINTQYKYLMNNQDYLYKVLKEGAEVAYLKASKTINKVKSLLGFIRI